ncbi:spore coat associated protein CotJA [Paenibacillus sp. 7124]|uniref:Spore coat associated protein CotJA n=1 Tax=Paenibacillus apii TaxID=1850370 RepID=A0A6M1PHM4_9BACL|nr:spore coat associated protein CotJA [Paenibacillus apii]NGM83047.1 spore coat associated protein CotJA [Paenibacillus apii]NJJ40188.1 spore coat associated protein CotJA [Paenibacillus apii]
MTSQAPNSEERVYSVYAGPFDPCPPVTCKTYVVPPHLFLGFQPPNLPQFNLPEALRLGTLWPALYSPYTPQIRGGN